MYINLAFYHQRTRWKSITNPIISNHVELTMKDGSFPTLGIRYNQFIWCAKCKQTFVHVLIVISLYIILCTYYWHLTLIFFFFFLGIHLRFKLADHCPTDVTSCYNLIWHRLLWLVVSHCFISFSIFYPWSVNMIDYPLVSFINYIANLVCLFDFSDLVGDDGWNIHGLAIPCT